MRSSLRSEQLSITHSTYTWNIDRMMKSCKNLAESLITWISSIDQIYLFSEKQPVPDFCGRMFI